MPEVSTEVARGLRVSAYCGRMPAGGPTDRGGVGRGRRVLCWPQARRLSVNRRIAPTVSVVPARPGGHPPVLTQRPGWLVRNDGPREPRGKLWRAVVLCPPVVLILRPARRPCRRFGLPGAGRRVRHTAIWHR